jgi:hypothetical protein
MSEKLKTSDIKTGGGVPKLLQPGNNVCKITKVELKEFKFKPGSYELILNMEGPDLGAGFEGFFIDKANESLGKHKGQIANVKATEWAFVDGTTKGGIVIKRDTEIMKFIMNLCKSIDGEVWWKGTDNRFDTIEDMVSAFNSEAPFKDKWLNVCLAGNEYDKNGYPAYALHLPKFSKDGVPHEKAGTTPSKVAKFNPSTHIKKKEVKNVENFGGETSGGIHTSNPFEL